MAHRLAQVSEALQGRYTIERELGRGGMATVYLAHDVKLRRRVALKVLHPDLGATLGPERFLREITIASRLTHPHILALHDSGEADGRLFYAMPYVDGESLRQRLDRESQLPVSEVIGIVRAVASALDYAHRQKVVHRDIKPENILLESGSAIGDPVRPLVADFGIARAVDAAAGARLTETGLTLGTPAYMSPEQAAASGHLDGRSDIYALGCVMYEMLAGAPPFTGSTAQAIMARHAVDPVPPLRTVRATVPEVVERAVARALAKVPADRFATAEEFGNALLAKDPSWVSRLRAITSRRARLILGLAAAAAVGLGFLLREESPAAVVPSATAIAVLPLRSPVGDTALTRLGRDLATTVSASLDGIGGIQTSDRLSIASETLDRPMDSPSDAAALARRLGAGSVLRGTLVGDGAMVRIDLGLYATEGFAPLAQGIAITGHRDSIGSLTDSVVWALLRRVWQQGKPPSPSLAAVTTRSLPALRAFLDGEREIERSEWEAAALAYRSAIAGDSGFVLAHFRYALARSWHLQEVEPGVIRALRRHRQTLPERERLLVEAFLTDTLHEEVERLRTVTRRFPDYWPGWFVHGDLIVHYGPLGGYDWTEGLEAFRRVVELNPSLIPAWEHIHAISQGRDQATAELAKAKLAELGWPGVEDQHFRLMHGLAREGGLITGELNGLADSVVRHYLSSPDEYGAKYGSFAMGLLQAGFPAAQLELNRRALSGGGASRRLNLEVGNAWAWAARGAWDSALTTLAELATDHPGLYIPRRFARFGDSVLAIESYGVAVLGAWLGATPPGQADQRRPAAIAAIDPLPDEKTKQDARGRMAWLDGVLGFTREDRGAIRAARRDAARSGYSQTAMVDGSLAAFERALAGDLKGAGREVAALEEECLNRRECNPFTPHIAIERLAAAQWFQKAGEIEDAVRLLRWQDAWIVGDRTLYTLGDVLGAPTFLVRARLEEARGEPRRARQYYLEFLRRYDNPMPSQAHLVEEAKAQLARLGEDR